MARRESLGRRRAFRDPLPRLLIVCEGTRTEPEYFRELRQSHRAVLEINISPGGVPRTLVRRAVQLKKEANRAAKSQRDDHLRYDEVWCVFDIDDHPDLAAALKQATDNGIHLAISNPCFELWILLHFQDQRAYIARPALRALCRKHLPGYLKDVPMNQLADRYDGAMNRAHELERWHSQQGRRHENPSTGVYRLTERIRKYGSPQ